MYLVSSNSEMSSNFKKFKVLHIEVNGKYLLQHVFVGLN